MTDVRMALEEIVDMIANCAGVPRNPDSLPQMIKAHAEKALSALASEQVGEEEIAPVDRNERVIQRLIDSAPEPLQNLGRYLADVLDADHWNHAEQYLLALAAILSRLSLREGDVALRAENEKLRQIICDCAWALPNGSAVAPSCSLDFMAQLPDEIRAVCARLSLRDRVKDEWQPIKTAPRDGSKIWAWLYDTGIKRVRFVSAKQSAADEGGDPKDYIDCWLDDDGDDWGPKFWLPLNAISIPASVIAVEDGEKTKWRDIAIPIPSTPTDRKEG